jgi:DNA primase
VKLEQAILEIKRRLKITEVIGRSVRLKKRGTNWIGLCPFHAEKTPSFNVHEEEGYFKCFGCGAGGDVFTFLEKKTGQLFVDIVRGLAGECGLALEGDIQGAASTKENARYEQQTKLLGALQAFFSNSLFDGHGKEALHYLATERKLTAEQLRRYGFGFAGALDDEVLKFLAKTGVELRDAESLGLVRLHQQGAPSSVFKGRITIPIRSQSGEIMAFGGRVFRRSDERAKYINSRASDHYKKKAVFFGLFESLPLIKRGLPAVIVEGYFDAVAVLEVGFPSVAPCGTSLTSQQLNLLKRHTDRIILCFDQDRAGKTAFQKALMAALELGFLVQVVDLGQAKDPDELRRQFGAEQLRKCIVEAKDAVEKLINRIQALASAGLKERIRGIRFLLPFLGAHPSHLVRKQYFRMAARALGEDEKSLEAEYELLKKPKKKNEVPVKSAPAVRESELPRSVTPVRHQGMSARHHMLFCGVLKDPRLIDRLDPELLADLPVLLKNLFLQLTDLLSKNKELTPHLLATQLYLPNEPTFFSAFVSAAKAAETLDYYDAERMVNGYIALEKARKEKAMLQETHEKMRRLSMEGEYAQAKALLIEQTESLKQKSPQPKAPEQPSKAISLLAPTTTRDYTVATDLPEDDGGWF